MNVFTPVNDLGTRLRFNRKDVKVIQGTLDTRGRGLKAIVEINGKQYKVYGKSCGLPNCMCDALIKPIN